MTVSFILAVYRVASPEPRRSTENRRSRLSIRFGDAFCQMIFAPSEGKYRRMRSRIFWIFVSAESSAREIRSDMGFKPLCTGPDGWRVRTDKPELALELSCVTAGMEPFAACFTRRLRVARFRAPRLYAARRLDEAPSCRLKGSRWRSFPAHEPRGRVCPADRGRFLPGLLAVL